MSKCWFKSKIIVVLENTINAKYFPIFLSLMFALEEIAEEVFNTR